MADNEMMREILREIDHQKRCSILREYLDEQDENLDLILTQLVIRLHAHFVEIVPGDKSLNLMLGTLLELLNCVFYGDPDSQNKYDYKINKDNLTKEDILINHQKLVTGLDKLRQVTRKII